MARPLRLEFEGAWYHVMNRGAGRRDIFADDDQRERFLDLLGELLERFGVETHAYCLMGNHYHLLLHTPAANLSRAMRHLDGVYTQHFNRSNATDGPLFRGRYRSIVVEADQYLLQVSRYIHRNPLEAGLVDDLVDYPWSSYRAYALDTDVTPWLYRSTIRSALSAQPARYRAFVEEPREDALEVDFEATAILGDDEFRSALLDRFTGDAREVPHTRTASASAPEPAAIAAAVADALGVERDAPLQAGRGRSNEARMMTMYLCQTVGRMELERIRSFFALGHYGSVAGALNRYRRLRADRPDLQRIEAGIRGDLAKEKT